MASNHTADPSVFNDPISMPDGSDGASVTQLRQVYEALADNCAFLKQKVDATQMRAALALRKRDVTFTDTSDFMAATTIRSGQNNPGPVLAMKTGQAAQAVYDGDLTEDYPGGNVPALGNIRGAAIGDNNRIVLVGQDSPYTAFKTEGGSWTNGGSEPGGALSGVVFSPGTDFFFTWRTTDVWRSQLATSWTSAPTGLAGVQAVAVVGAGAGANRVIALSSAATPAFALSTNNGASFSAGGTVPYSAVADEAGYIASCPSVSRLDLRNYVYHAARCNAGSEIRTARSQDGVTWEAGPVITAPAGRTFTQAIKLFACPTTGLLVITSEETITANSHDFRVFYASLDFSSWLGTATAYGGITSNAVDVAGGRIFATDGAVLWASDGIQIEVFS